MVINPMVLVCSTQCVFKFHKPYLARLSTERCATYSVVCTTMAKCCLARLNLAQETKSISADLVAISALQDCAVASHLHPGGWKAWAHTFPEVGDAHEDAFALLHSAQKVMPLIEDSLEGACWTACRKLMKLISLGKSIKDITRQSVVTRHHNVRARASKLTLMQPGRWAHSRWWKLSIVFLDVHQKLTFIQPREWAHSRWWEVSFLAGHPLSTSCRWIFSQRHKHPVFRGPHLFSDKNAKFNDELF